MKSAGLIGAGLILLLGASVSTYAQERKEEPKEQAKPAENRESKPAPRSGAVYGGNYHGGVRATEPEHGGVHPSGVPQHAGQVRAGFVQSRAKSWESEHRTWAQRGGYNGYRIPDDRFRTYFGHDHFFRISRLPLLFVGGLPRFQYDGYWVTFVDPWPEGWAATWYETDDCYIDYVNDGYYIFDRNYPGVPIAVTISF